MTTIAFSGEQTGEPDNLASTVLQYILLFVAVAWLPVGCEPWIERNGLHFYAAGAVITVAHLSLWHLHRRAVQAYSDCPALEDGEDEFPVRLGLHY